MKKFPITPSEIFFSAWRNRELILQMTRREVMGRYKGSMLGLVWSFFHPVLMLCVYTFVFSVVFKARWHGASDSKSEFAVALFVGMIVFGIFSECIGRAPGLVLGNPNYVKKVVFPLEIMPWVTLGAALFHAFISWTVLLIYLLAMNRSLAWTTILLPIVISPLLFLILGLSWLLSSLGVYLRDVGQAIGLLTTVLMFMSPVFYPVDALPTELRPWLLLNPLAIIIEQTRIVSLWAMSPDWIGLGQQLGISLAIAWLGFAFFQKTRNGFGDVL